jgi:hypothetical protein
MFVVKVRDAQASEWRRMVRVLGIWAASLGNPCLHLPPHGSLTDRNLDQPDLDIPRHQHGLWLRLRPIRISFDSGTNIS